MLGLNSDLMYSVHRIRTTFSDDIGNSKRGFGTGFWLETQDGRNTFITNKHNVDPSVKYPTETRLRLCAFEIELRLFQVNPTPETKFFHVGNVEQCLKQSYYADCAILFEPSLKEHDGMTYPISTVIKVKDLADADKFSTNQIQVMESAMFIGFPGSSGVFWYDERWKMPIARQCVLASVPYIPFTHSQIQTMDVCLVSGMSFSGGSGSPVFLPARGIPPGGDLRDPNWRPALLIGIMSGHFWDKGSVPGMFDHTGLSYLTRSTSILSLL